MEDTNKTYKLKLPSDANDITKDVIWSYIKSIGYTGSTFTKEDLKASGLISPVDDTIKRVLSYLKYLDVIEETREISKGAEKKEAVQKFTRSKDPLIGEMFYELDAKREQEAKTKWKEHLGHHSAYIVLKDEFLAGSPSKKFLDLEHFLKSRPELQGKSAQYYQEGGKFLLDLFSDVGLLSIKENSITLGSSVSIVVSPDSDAGSTSPVSIKTFVPDSPKSVVTTEGAYVVSIRGSDIHMDININEEADFLILDAILKKIKAKILVAVKEEKNEVE